MQSPSDKVIFMFKLFCMFTVGLSVAILALLAFAGCTIATGKATAIRVDQPPIETASVTTSNAPSLQPPVPPTPRAPFWAITLAHKGGVAVNTGDKSQVDTTTKTTEQKAQQSHVWRWILFGAIGVIVLGGIGYFVFTHKRLAILGATGL